MVLQLLLWLGVGSYNFMKCIGKRSCCVLYLFVNLVLCSWLVSLGGFMERNKKTLKTPILPSVTYPAKVSLPEEICIGSKLEA